MIDGGVLISQDLSCMGQVSLSVALPILGACRLKLTVLPTAILSTHTGGFGNNTYLDLSHEMTQITKHWQELDISFKAAYLGYLGENALDFWLQNKELLSQKIILIDPAMADHGKMYRSLSQQYIEKMRQLVTKATILTPNMTEAAFLLGKKAEENTIQTATSLAQELSTKFDIPNVIITGIDLSDEKIGEVGITEGKEWSLTQRRLPGSFFGTGDIFASVFLAAFIHQYSLKESCSIAADFVERAILNTPKQDPRLGPNYAAGLNWLLEKVGNRK
ncbi:MULTISPECIES: pyridoxamine kinase [unclassified Lactobacillus]|uniref:pyridoxamine kinase n=1 Tax=unclassified Lactobacillus TaxID=2620435 RepID=UPI000BEEB7DF|nr:MULTISPECIES: pyridoxamine kinase [unclassified Lactobacillus]PEG87760.1 pyridoxal kinase [Lactobacillus sp. UMNPBX14]PEH03372.1 pyridoxal kinase [Lactobacillus sp. UMNPBX6]